MPRLEIPLTARRRRWRNKSALRFPTAAIRKIVLSSRWVSLFLLALCIASLVIIGMDKNFYLTLIPVEGVESIPPREIVNASGLGGAHIFAVNPGEAAERITTIPGVISATVTLKWPNSAYIQLAEDSPVAIWEQDGKEYWINAGGELIPARIEVPGLLRIRSEATTPMSASASKLAPGDPAEAEATEEAPMPSLLFIPEEVLAGALQLRELRPNIDALYYNMSGGLSYQDGRGWRVYFGSGTDMAQKLVVYETIVEDLLAKGATPVYISVSNQEKPYFLAHGT